MMFTAMAAFLAAHAALGAWMDDYPKVATAHALATLLAALGWALARQNQHRIALAAAYIMGAEVLWRMTDARIPYESAKFAIAGLFLIGLLRRGAQSIHGPAVLYLLLLAPSTLLTVAALPPGPAREQISFNLSGPLALGMSVLFFTGVHMTEPQFLKLLLAPLGPAVGIASIAIRRTITAETIQFTQESNYLTSGGFGPNQVSAVLGLGAFLALWLALRRRAQWSVRGLALLVMGALAAQGALTFSRGGLLTAGLAASVAVLFLVQEQGVRARILTLAPLAFAAGALWIAPRLNEFTGGALGTRLQDTRLESRTELALAELRVWGEHPLLGAGPGMAREARALPRTLAASHTEYTRLLAEHGLFGLGALLLLVLMVARRASQARSPAARAMVLSMMGWTLLYMSHSAMRLAAPGLLFGLAWASPRFRGPGLPTAAAEPEPALEPASSLLGD
jgi:O-antigen ligase